MSDGAVLVEPGEAEVMTGRDKAVIVATVAAAVVPSVAALYMVWSVPSWRVVGVVACVAVVAWFVSRRPAPERWGAAALVWAAGGLVYEFAGLVAGAFGWSLSPWWPVVFAPGVVGWVAAVLGFNPAAWTRWAVRLVLSVFPRGDPEPAPEPPAPARSYDQLTIGTCTETGEPWVLPFDIGMVLLVGATGAGKSSVLWSMLAELAPGVPEGMVRLCGVDPKTLELGRASELFAWWVSSTDHTGLSGLPAELEPDAMWLERVAWALEREVSLMNDRTRKMRRARQVKFVPTPGDPLTVVVVDELLRITATVSDSSLKARINTSLVELLSNGRAAGWRVIAATQLVDAKVLDSMRKLFPLRICLRVATKFDVDMTLGGEARAVHGADAHLIPSTEQGAGYVLDEESCTALRVRARFVSDREVAGLVAEYGTPHVEFEPPPLAFPAVVSHVADRVASVWPEGERAMHVDELAVLLGVSSDELAGELRDAGGPVEPRVSRLRSDGVKTSRRGLRWEPFVGWRAGL